MFFEPLWLLNWKLDVLALFVNRKNRSRDWEHCSQSQLYEAAPDLVKGTVVGIGHTIHGIVIVAGAGFG